MIKFATLLLIAAGIAPLCFAARDRDHEDRWPIRADDNLARTLPLNGAPMRIVLDNFEGFVHVTGSTRKDVEVKAHRTVRADTDADLALANREVKLDITGENGTVSAYYDALWRCNEGNRGCDHSQRRFYAVIYDLDVEVPRGARLFASTVTRGDVRVTGLDSTFEVRNVNGPVTLSRMGGSGEARTVNGPIDATFSANPKEDCSFKTVNGSLNITFAQPLSADLFFKTFNGEIYSDFDVTALPIPVGAGEQRDGRFVYRSNREHGARAGHGGPQLHFDTLNGNINLRTAKGGR